MATMRPINFLVRDKKTDQKVEFTSAVSCDSDGVFHCTIPEYLQESADQLLKSMNKKAAEEDGSYYRRGEIWIDQPRDNYRVSGSVLKQCEQFIRKACENYMEVEETVELVIVYKRQTNCSFCAGEDGTIYQNGSLAQDATGSYKWFKNDGLRMSTDHHEFYSIGLNAAVVEKVTYHRPGGDKIIYRNPEGEGNTNLGDGYLLNNWVKLIAQDYSGELDGDWEQMPYTPQAENFFNEMMKSLCSLAYKMDMFFGDKEKLHLAIKSNKLFLPSNNSNESKGGK